MGRVGWEVFANYSPQQKPVCIPLGPLLPGDERPSLDAGAFVWDSGLGEAYSTYSESLRILSLFILPQLCHQAGQTVPLVTLGQLLSLLTPDTSDRLWLQPEGCFHGSFVWGTTSFPVRAEDGSSACPTLKGLLLSLWVATITPVISVIVKYDQYLMTEFGL